MELRQLSYFVAVADEGHFTRAAARVSVAQPAVSAQIRRLERELGEPLFHRDRRGVRLTSAGDALLPHARAALAAAQRGRDTIASMRGLLAEPCGSAWYGRWITASRRHSGSSTAPIPRSTSRSRNSTTSRRWRHCPPAISMLPSLASTASR